MSGCVHWHVHKSPLSEEETKCDSSRIRTRNPEFVKRMSLVLCAARIDSKIALDEFTLSTIVSRVCSIYSSGVTALKEAALAFFGLMV